MQLSCATIGPCRSSVSACAQSRAKQQREHAILTAARALGTERGIRQITAHRHRRAVGMHKSALLRYFETREQIFLRLTAEGWQEWAAALARAGEAARLGGTVAAAFATTPPARGMFCDLLAQAPLNLERTSPRGGARVQTRHPHEVDAIVEAINGFCPAYRKGRHRCDRHRDLTVGRVRQMANPPPEIAALYRSDKRMSHAVFEIEPRVRRVLTAMLKGMML